MDFIQTGKFLGPYKGYYCTVDKDDEDSKRLTGKILFLDKSSLQTAYTMIDLYDKFTKAVDKYISNVDFFSMLTESLDGE